jgi:hypothetical protein
MKFLNDNVFTTPDWLLQENILRNIGPEGILPRVRSLQVRQLNSLMREERLNRLVEQEAFNGNKAYALTDMLQQLREGIWSELGSGQDVDAFRRNLQRSHVSGLAKLMSKEGSRTDLNAAARAELKRLHTSAKAATQKYKPGIVRYHLEDVVAEIEDMLDMED